MTERFSGVDDKITTWRGITIAVLTVLGFGILIVVLRESLHSPPTPSNPAVESTRSKEPIHELNQNGSAPTEIKGNPANTPTLGPRPTPRTGK
jgi:hypothetical protein